DGTFAFASELKALLRIPGLPRDVDLAAVDAFLALQYVPGDVTALRGIRKVPPGHLLVVEGESERVERYWMPEAAEPSSSEEDVAATLPRLAAAYDEPLGDEAAFPTFLIAEQARRHVTVALAGDGGDEAFAGYERYIAHGLAGRIPVAGARAGAAALRRLPA